MRRERSRMTAAPILSCRRRALLARPKLMLSGLRGEDAFALAEAIRLSQPLNLAIGGGGVGGGGGGGAREKTGCVGGWFWGGGGGMEKERERPAKRGRGPG